MLKNPFATRCFFILAVAMMLLNSSCRVSEPSNARLKSPPPSEEPNNTTPPSVPPAMLRALTGGYTNGSTFLSETFSVPPADFRDFQFTATDKSKLEGKFEVNGDGYVVVLVLDDRNVAKLRSGERVASYYETDGPKNSGTVAVELSPKSYHLVFLNGPSGSSKAVSASFKLLIQ
jgi:hypothetical protein